MIEMRWEDAKLPIEPNAIKTFHGQPVVLQYRECTYEKLYDANSQTYMGQHEVWGEWKDVIGYD